jgi:hypothetical protein
MKTTYFQKVQLSDTGKRRLRELVELPDDAKDALASWITKCESLPREYRPILEELATITTASADQLADAIYVSLDVLTRLGEFDDSLADFIEDLETVGFFTDESQYQTLARYLTPLVPYAKRIYLLERKETVEDRGAPLLRRASIGVAVKPVFDRDFCYGEERVTDYNPIIISHTVTTQIELSLQGADSTVSFQLCEETLDRFVSDLLIAQRQIQKAKAGLPVIENAAVAQEESPK